MLLKGSRPYVLYWFLLIVCICLDRQALAQLPQDPTLRVRLPWQFNAESAGFLVAQHFGWYRQAGLSVELLPKATHSTDTDAVSRHLADVYIVPGLVFLRLREHYPLKAFFANYQTSPLVLYAHVRSGIHGISDIAGKVFGVRNTDEAKMLQFLTFPHRALIQGIRIQQTDNVDRSLLDGQVDFALGFEMNQPLLLAMQGAPIAIFADYRHLTNFYGSLYVATEHYIAANVDRLARFIEATEAGWRFARQYPGKTATLIVDHFMPPRDRAFARRLQNIAHQQRHLLASLRHRIAHVGNDGIGTISPSILARGISLMRNVGLIHRRLDPQSCYTNVVLQAWKGQQRDPKKEHRNDF